MTVATQCQRLERIPVRGFWEPRPFSIEPVIRLCSRDRLSGRRTRQHGGAVNPDGAVCLTALCLGVDREIINGWRTTGLTANQADVAAILLGHHPSAIWPDWFSQMPTELELAASEPRPRLHRKKAPVDRRGFKRLGDARVEVALCPTTPLEHRMAQMRLERLSARAIAEALTLQKVRTPAGNRVWMDLIVTRLINKMKG